MKENIIIAGSSGAIGGEFIKLYANKSNVEKIIALSRKSINNDHDKIQSVEIDYNDEATLKNLDVISQLDSISKIIIATGILHTDHIKPEKSIDGIDEGNMKAIFQVNVFGPILLVKKLLPLVKKSKGVKIVFLTARVGSVSDNELGGWHSYRSSKTALNMMIKNLSYRIKKAKQGTLCDWDSPWHSQKSSIRTFLETCQT